MSDLYNSSLPAWKTDIANLKGDIAVQVAQIRREMQIYVGVVIFFFLVSWGGILEGFHMISPAIQEDFSNITHQFDTANGRLAELEKGIAKIQGQLENSGKPNKTAVNPQPGAADAIISAVTRIRTQAHTDLPIKSNESGVSERGPLSFINSTPYPLTVYLLGPKVRRLQILAGKQISLNFPTGDYEIAAESPGNPIIPSYGRLSYKTGTFSIEFQLDSGS